MNSSLIVIGITGRMGAGKDTAALALQQRGYWRLALADSMKGGLEELGGPTREVHKRIDAAGWANRKAWQQFGTEAREDAGCPALWIYVALAKISFLSRLLPEAQQHRRFVIPDIRYPHEHYVLQHRVRKWGGAYETWRIERPGLSGDQSHSSEQQVERVAACRVLDNSGPIEHLVGQVNGAADLAESEHQALSTRIAAHA